VEWISEAWKEMPENMIRKSFLKDCLSNAADWEQDDNSEASDDDASNSECDSEPEETSEEHSE